MWNFRQFGERIAIIDSNGCQLTYNELASRGDDFASKIEPRSLIFIMCKNEIDSVVAYTAAIEHGIVPLLIKADIDEELKQNLLDTYRPAYVYEPAVDGYQLRKTDFKDKVKLFENLALLLTTSGSTGSPKLVRQSYINIESNAKAIVEYLELDETERPITTLPMNYTYGLSIINSHLMVGATILLTEFTLMNREFWAFFKEQNATSFGGVPYTYEILKKLRFFRMDLPSLKTMTQAGGKLSSELHGEFATFAEEHGKRFVVMYGQTEATARMGYLPAEKAIEKQGSMGIAIPGGVLRLRDSDGNNITEPNVEGELIYEGPNVTLGYATCLEELELGDERGGVLETGDMARMDEDGYFYIVGRLKRFLKIYGNRVNLDEIEGLIKTRFKEIDCACAGVDDHLYTFVTTEEEQMHKDVEKFLAEKTGLNFAAFTIKCINEIPKNEAGKVQYRLLEQYYD